MGLLHHYRATGADLPFGQVIRAHPGVAMEGYFWRLTDPSTGRVLIALCGASEGPRGAWSTVGLAAWPVGFVRADAVAGARANPQVLGVRGGNGTFDGNARNLHVDLGPDARLDVKFEDLVPWPRRSLGGSSVFQMVPGLNQYWHPWLLNGSASGTATLGDEVWEFHDAQVYAEKNWGREGFPASWWWGQAHGFDEPAAYVAFAGGLVTAGPLRTEVTALVVRLPDGRVIRLGNPVVSPVHADTSDERWQLSGRGFGWRIEVHGTAPLSHAFVLPVPLPSEHRNVPGDLEHLAAALTITVHRFGKFVWRGDSTIAALEHSGLQRARTELLRRGLDPRLPSAPPIPN